MARRAGTSGDGKRLERGELARAATYRVDLEYEGTRYSGWQDQRNARTVAGVLRAAVEECAGPVLDLGGAGRTDAGVHALHQVAHLRLQSAPDPVQLWHAVNERLPADVNVLALASAAARFHARHDAESRAYLYQIARRRSAFGKRFAWWVHEGLDAGALGAALALVRGTHDFGAFCQDPGAAGGTRCSLARTDVVEDGDLVLVRLEADRFLWRMVRRLVGAAVRVATGALAVEEFRGALAAGASSGLAPRIAEWTAPAAGLFLERVRYPGDAPAGPVRSPAPVASFDARRDGAERGA